MKLLHRLSYNGGRTIEEKDQRSFWGMNVLPSYLEMEGLITENKTLKNSYKNLKKEKNKVLQKNEKLEEKIKTLEQEIAGYKARIQELSGQENK